MAAAYSPRPPFCFCCLYNRGEVGKEQPPGFALAWRVIILVLHYGETLSHAAGVGTAFDPPVRILGQQTAAIHGHGTELNGGMSVWDR